MRIASEKAPIRVSRSNNTGNSILRIWLCEFLFASNLQLKVESFTSSDKRIKSFLQREIKGKELSRLLITQLGKVGEHFWEKAVKEKQILRFLMNIVANIIRFYFSEFYGLNFSKLAHQSFVSIWSMLSLVSNYLLHTIKKQQRSTFHYNPLLW